MVEDSPTLQSLRANEGKKTGSNLINIKRSDPALQLAIMKLSDKHQFSQATVQ